MDKLSWRARKLLYKTIEWIENNPGRYNQLNPSVCIIGIMEQLTGWFPIWLGLTSVQRMNLFSLSKWPEPYRTQLRTPATEAEYDKIGIERIYYMLNYGE